MMKSLKTIVCFLFVSLFFLGAVETKAQALKKEIKKNFAVKKGDILDVENKFGDINIIKWDKQEISISVSLSAESKNNETARKMMDDIVISIDRQNNIISAETVIESESGSYGNNKFAVNYTIEMPSWMNLNLSNKFGNIYMDEVVGKVTIDLKHGELRMKSLVPENSKIFNQIDLSYSTAVMDNGGNLQLDLSFSKFDAEQCGVIIADSKYSGINITRCESFTIDSKYDNFRFENLSNLKGDLKYSNIKIGQLRGITELESTFSGVKIDQLMPEFESISLENSRGGFKMGIMPDTPFDLNAEVVNGDINLTGFDLQEKKVEGNTKYLKASNGLKAKQKPVNIKIVDGSASIFKTK
ncbi:MAG: hypothetical protein H6540_02170 [Bacteroidales bacterium]|nr:hypothetical protein [Bacteroidales bacterium]